jgi:hypothetical protein
LFRGCHRETSLRNALFDFYDALFGGARRPVTERIELT